MLSCCPSDVFKNPNSSLSALLLGALPTDIGVQALAVLGCALLQQYNKLKETHIALPTDIGVQALAVLGCALLQQYNKLKETHIHQ